MDRSPENRMEGAPGPQQKRMEGAPGPLDGASRPRDKRLDGAAGPAVANAKPGPLGNRMEGASGPPGKRLDGVAGPAAATGRRKDGLDHRMDMAPGPPARRVDTALGPPAKRADTAPGPPAKKVDVAAGPPAKRTDMALGPPAKRTDTALGPPVRREDLGPPAKRADTALGPPAKGVDTALGPPSKRVDTALGPPAKSMDTALGPPAKSMDTALGPPSKSTDTALGPPSKSTDIAPGPVNQAAPLGNAKGHLAGRDLAREPAGRTEGPDCAPLGPPAVRPDPSQGLAPGPAGSRDPAARPLCALRAAQMSSRQQELGARARRLCRRLQVIQAKQVERHVRQQLSGLAEMLSERGAAGLPGSPQAELDRLACSSSARLRAAQGGFDSDATESSSGGESEEEEEEEAGESPEREEEEPSRDPGCERRAEWRWAVERAAIICRWTWLQAQVSDLEFRIRQQTEIYKQIRCSKGGIVLGDAPHCEDSASRQTSGPSLTARGNRVPSSCSRPPPKAPPGGDPCDRSTPNPSPHTSQKQCSRLTPSVDNAACQNPPPPTPACDPRGPQKAARQVNGLINCVRSSAWCNGSAEDGEEVLGKKRRVDPPNTSPALSDSTCVAARTRPLRGHKKRSLVRSGDVSSLSRKPQKPLSVKCGCDPPTTCILCGCKTYAKTSHPSAMPLNERIALMDPGYHPILSFPYEKPLHLHFEALLKEDRQFRGSNKLKILKLSHLAKKPQDGGRSMFRDDRQYKGMSSPGIHVSSPVTPRPNPSSHQFPSLPDTPPSASQQNSASAALKRKRLENSYDIDNIVIPMSLVAASRVEKLQYKEILTPSWRVLDSTETEVLHLDPQLEDLSDDAYQDRHSKYEELERSRWDSWTSALPQRRGSRSSNKSDGRWTPVPPNGQGSSQPTTSPDSRLHSLNDLPLSLSSDGAEPYSNVQCLSVHSRSRVLSWSEDTRSSTPEIPDDEEQVGSRWQDTWLIQIVQPWEPRPFPLSDRDCRALRDAPGTPGRGRTKPDVAWPTKPGAWTESAGSGAPPTENLTPASKEPPLPNSISVVRVRAHSGDKIASLEYFPPRPANKR